jgi:hypothetical protein
MAPGLSPLAVVGFFEEGLFLKNQYMRGLGIWSFG